MTGFVFRGSAALGLAVDRLLQHLLVSLLKTDHDNTDYMKQIFNEGLQPIQGTLYSMSVYSESRRVSIAHVRHNYATGTCNYDMHVKLVNATLES